MERRKVMVSKSWSNVFASKPFSQATSRRSTLLGAPFAGEQKLMKEGEHEHLAAGASAMGVCAKLCTVFVSYVLSLRAPLLSSCCSTKAKDFMIALHSAVRSECNKSFRRKCPFLPILFTER
jgi:hypothetical protein